MPLALYVFVSGIVLSRPPRDREDRGPTRPWGRGVITLGGSRLSDGSRVQTQILRTLISSCLPSSWGSSSRPVYPGMPDAEVLRPMEPPRKLQAAQHRQGRGRPPGTRNGGPRGARAEPPALGPRSPATTRPIDDRLPGPLRHLRATHARRPRPRRAAGRSRPRSRSTRRSRSRPGRMRRFVPSGSPQRPAG